MPDNAMIGGRPAGGGFSAWREQYLTACSDYCGTRETNMPKPGQIVDLCFLVITPGRTKRAGMGAICMRIVASASRNRAIAHEKERPRGAYVA